MPDVFVVIDRKSRVRTDVDWSTVDVDQLEQTAEACPWFAITVTCSPPEGT